MNSPPILGFVSDLGFEKPMATASMAGDPHSVHHVALRGQRRPGELGVQDGGALRGRGRGLRFFFLLGELEIHPAPHWLFGWATLFFTLGLRSIYSAIPSLVVWIGVVFSSSRLEVKILPELVVWRFDGGEFRWFPITPLRKPGVQIQMHATNPNQFV